MKKRTLYIASIITIIVGMISYFAFYIKKSDNTSEYIAITPIATHINGMDFIDSATCVECHAQIVEDHYKTAHFNSLQPANETTIKGSFDKIKTH
ncbi:hypothetical protein [Aquimarina sp. Aq107]|uniref:hypothetical protein n=1 Tax=Aquimarina sp. Aq107 TaxID=1191912 RepID=UPI000D560CB0|nr:hypothetical protein [Aquimarina sp. Aq107]